MCGDTMGISGILPHPGTRGLSDSGLAKLIYQVEKLEKEAVDLARRAGMCGEMVRKLREVRREEREAKEAGSGGE
jgi:hypothetical protein